MTNDLGDREERRAARQQRLASATPEETARLEAAEATRRRKRVAGDDPYMAHVVALDEDAQGRRFWRAWRQGDVEFTLIDYQRLRPDDDLTDNTWAWAKYRVTHRGLSLSGEVRTEYKKWFANGERYPTATEAGYAAVSLPAPDRPIE